MRPGAPSRRPANQNRDPSKTTEPGKTTDPDRAIVLGWIEELVRAGLARSHPLPGGERELRLITGEVFRLTRDAIFRAS